MITRAVPAVVLFGICCLPAVADPREDTLAGISRCASLSDDRTFLNCIYGAAQPMRAELGLPPAPASQTNLVPTPPIHAAAATPMTASSSLPKNVSETSGITAGSTYNSGTQRMTSYSFDPRGHFTVTLSDGKVWRQLDSDQDFANWTAPAAHYYVTVKGSNGSFYLDVTGDSSGFRVEPMR